MELCDDNDLVLGAGCGGTCACCSLLMKFAFTDCCKLFFGGEWSCEDDDVFCVMILAVVVNV